MRAIGILIIFLVVSLAKLSYAAYPQTSIQQGAHFVSPDGRYSLELQETDQLSYYAIRDIKTGNVDRSLVMPSLLLYLRWAQNSRAIVAVEHIPHGSCGRLIFLTDSKWADVEVRPPGEELKDYAVVELTLDAKYVHYRFAVRYIEPNGMPIRYALCDLHVSLESRGISNLHWTPISQAQWATSLEQKPIYKPPMQ